MNGVSPGGLKDNDERSDMPGNDRLQRARDVYDAYVSGDRSVVEEALGENFTFYSPPDPGIDRSTYFERCWPNSELLESFDFVRLIEAGDEVIVTYESTKTDGKRFRNTEILTFDGAKLSKVEVYFGWNLS
jgi:ketosteroid isomerase-like protein